MNTWRLSVAYRDFRLMFGSTNRSPNFTRLFFGDLSAGMHLTEERRGDLAIFHEAGHIYAHAAHWDNFNDALTDLYADLFATSYIRTSRADLSAVLPIEVPTRVKQPHISRLDGWNLLSDELGVKTFDWFELQLVRMASFVTSPRNLKDLVSMLQAKFPADEAGMSEQMAERFCLMHAGLCAFLRQTLR